ncbi:hypothetical protein B5P44_01200 [Mycobacterium sp. CBMA 213]|uniref:Uncharacterized protein n=1 Tax=Mycolicibacterium sp. CBMA 213 TaxID=1968788 RepID=A0A343VRN4_9MYCO|nr:MULTISPECIES: hypothetical protein [unclassified Mycolicibacterium]AVN58558.1 hypothetical protein B5P44_p00263 [Mycolicibacterium sp. CBMA 213]MUL61200.1 hypothetical protein [Mycolicibacterium sp. CBMA 335]MUM03437.1 hypothetical protein [Mycolicibacterium sp. CBMA 213]
MTDSLVMVRDYAAGPPPVTYEMARAALMLPVLWGARAGTLSPGWRALLPTTATVPNGDWHLYVLVAMELAELEIQPWEPDGNPAFALDSWFTLARREAFAVADHAARDFERGLVSLKVVLACHAACVLTDASYLAAGGNPLVVDAAVSPLDMPAEGLISAPDRARTALPVPATWESWINRPMPGMEADVVTLLHQKRQETCAAAVRDRLAVW